MMFSQLGYEEFLDCSTLNMLRNVSKYSLFMNQHSIISQKTWNLQRNICCRSKKTTEINFE
jgi:hypothetical protein